MSYLLIDGENFKCKIGAVLKHHENRPVWHEYNFKDLIGRVLKGIKVERALIYFARVKEHPQTKQKSKMLIEEQRLLKRHLEKQGFEVILSGRVRGYMEDGFLGKKVLVFKEKGIDVKLATDLIVGAVDNKYDTAIVVSSDGDLVPAIDWVRLR